MLDPMHETIIELFFFSSEHYILLWEKELVNKDLSKIPFPPYFKFHFYRKCLKTLPLIVCLAAAIQINMGEFSRDKNGLKKIM